MDIYACINQLYEIISYQGQEIKQLKEELSALTEQMKELSVRPSVKVERLEYKFDQLKVETLEGTLHIGLNPSDFSSFEDISIPPQATNQSASGGTVNHHGIETRLNQFIEQNLPAVIKEAETECGAQLNEDYRTFIKEDIMRQLPQRISHYARLIPPDKSRSGDSKPHEEQIVQSIIHDIQQAVRKFISQLPNNMKGGDIDGTARSE